MAVLAVVKNGVGSLVQKAADKAGNLVSKASSLSSNQIKAAEEAREKYLREKPETDPEFLKRKLGIYAVEAYEAYLTQLQTLYRPISLGDMEDDKALNNRIRYFEITKWVTDPTENNLDKLTNLYRVLSEEACNIALIYDRPLHRQHTHSHSCYGSLPFPEWFHTVPVSSVLGLCVFSSRLDVSFGNPPQCFLRL